MNKVYRYSSNFFHTFKKNNKYFLFFINNLSFFEISKPIYQVLKISSPITIFKIKEKYQSFNLELIKDIIYELYMGWF